jgi:hypothetical protein
MAAGGVVNLVSRSGSNKFEVEMNATGENYLTRLNLDGLDARNRDYFYILNPSISGPIIKDRLWYSLNAELLTNRTARPRDPEGIQPDPLPLIENYYKGTFKLTWQVSSRHKLQSVSNFDHYFPVNRNAALGVDRDAQNRAISFKHFTGLVWEAVLTDNIVFRSQAGLVSTSADYYPNRCVDEKDVCDFIPAVIQKYPRMQTYQNATTHDRNNLLSFQFINRLEFFLSSRALGEHDVQIKDNLITQDQTDRRSVPGDRVYELNGGPEALTTYYSNDPRLEPARYGWYISPTTSLRNVVSVLDAWRPTRHLTITPGAAFTTATAGQPARRGRDQRARSHAQHRRRLGRHARRAARCCAGASTSTSTPRCTRSPATTRAAWCPSAAAGTRRRRRTRASACTREARRAPPSGCVWALGLTPPASLAGRTSGSRGPGSTRSAPSARWCRAWPSGSTSSIGCFVHQYETVETNRIWNPAGTQLDGLGGYRNGRAQTVTDLETPDGARRRGTSGSPGRSRGARGASSCGRRTRGAGSTDRCSRGLSNRYGDIPRATSSSTGRSPTITATRSRRCWATRSPRGCPSACATRSTRAAVQPPLPQRADRPVRGLPARTSARTRAPTSTIRATTAPSGSPICRA